MTRQALGAVLLAVALGGCSVYREATRSQMPATAQWRTIATDADRVRLRNWHQAWDEALPKARSADAAGIAAGTLLFDPDRALAHAMPPPGAYRCRTYKLGAQGTGISDFVAYPWFDCRIADEGEVQSFQKLTGSQRPTGLLFPENDARAIFLGTLVLGDETAPLRYGLDASRDMVGYVERIEPKRWRLVLPYPRFESTLDVTELVPAG